MPPEQQTPLPQNQQPTPNNNQATQGALYVLASGVVWGTTGTAQALAPAGAQSLVLGTLRQVIGGLALLLLAIARGQVKRDRFQQWPWRNTVLAAVSIAAYQLFFFSGVARTGVAVGTIVGIGSAPIAGGIIGWFLRGERPSPRWYAATAVAIVGCGFLAISSGDIRVNGFGMLLAICAGTAYSAYAAFSKDILDQHPPEIVMAVIFCLAGFLLLPLLFFYDLSWLWTIHGILIALHLGIITMALAYSLFARGLKRVSLATALTLTLAEPLTAGILGIVVLNEPVTLLTVLGIGLLLAGLLILTYRPRRRAVVHKRAG